MAVQIREQSLESALTAEAYARKQKEILPAIYDELDFLQEGSHKASGPGDGYFLGFRFRSDTDEMLMAKAIYLSSGPIVAELLLRGPAADSREKDRWFGAIEKSFSLQSMDFLAKAVRGPLLGKLPAIDSASTPPSTRYPLACAAIPAPPGWVTTSSENGEVVFTSNAAEIRLRRSLIYGDRPADWYQNRLEQLKASGSLVLGTDQGHCSRGPYVALLFEDRALARTWKTTGSQQTLELFLSDEQPLLWALRAPQASFPACRSDLEWLIAATRFLPPEEWRTRPAEPWLTNILQGPWQPEGNGLYLRTPGAPLLLQTDRREKSPSLEKIQSLCKNEGFPKSYGVKTVLSSSDEKGLWRNCDAYRFSLDGLTSDYAPVSLRASWFLAEGLLYSIAVKGADSRSVDALQVELLEGLRLTLH